MSEKKNDIKKPRYIFESLMHEMGSTNINFKNNLLALEWKDKNWIDDGLIKISCIEVWLFNV